MNRLYYLWVTVLGFTILTSCQKTIPEPTPGVAISTYDKKSLANQAQVTNNNKVVVGYVPGWANTQSVSDNIDFDIVTHVNLAFFLPNTSGEVMTNGQPLYSDYSASTINYIVNKAHAKGRLVLASIGGPNPNPNAGDLAVQFRSANRTNFINNLSAFLTYFNLDGVDVDVEGNTLTTIKNEQNYAPFVNALKNKISPDGKIVTAATGAPSSTRIPSSSYGILDLIHLMSYDNGWGGSGNHSTYNASISQVQTLLDAGVPASKLTLGIPFYGYKPTVGSGAKAYKDILALYGGAAAYVDSYDGYQYNGITTIESKTEYASQNIRGVMIWTLSQDVTGSYSLLQAVGRKINPAP